MRSSSPELEAVLAAGTFDYHYIADLIYNGERRMQQVPIKSPRFRESANATVQHSGTCTIVWTDEFATSITPEDVTDPLAPFGAQLVVYVVVTAGPFMERVEYGRFEITDVPSARDEWFRFRGDWLVAGSTVELELKDLTAGVGAESFDAPSAPSQLASTWSEVAALTGFPVVKTVPDVPVSRSILYPDSKLDAVYELMSVMLDAVPHLSPNGSIMARPNVWPEPVAKLRIGEGLVSVTSSMSQGQVYNRVRVRATTGETVLAVAEVTSGPLRVRNADGSVSPFRARTTERSSELVTTREQALAWAASELAKVSVLRTRTVEVVETFNPLRERGDVVDIERPTKWLHGRIQDIDPQGATQRLTVTISRESPRLVPTRPAWPPYLFDSPFLDGFTDLF